MSEIVTVFIISRNRPLYLWASLDSLFKYTVYPHRFVIGDNGSDDPLVHKILQGFRRRGMFSSELVRSKNDPDLLEQMLSREIEHLGKYFAVVESDVLVFPQKPCWLETFVSLMNQDDLLAMLGSQVDQSDFVNQETLGPFAEAITQKNLDFLTKSRSSERLPIPQGVNLIETPGPWLKNPPGRLLLFRTSAVKSVFDFKISHLFDTSFCEGLVNASWKAAVSTEVKHRHLSLLNIFDYPDYSLAERKWYFAKRPKEHQRNRELQS